VSAETCGPARTAPDTEMFDLEALGLRNVTPVIVLHAPRRATMRGMAPTPHERAEAERREKRARFEAQHASGRLVIRSMTKAEREMWEKRDRELPEDERERREAARAKRARRTSKQSG
jgi:hypothetical protein